MVKRPLTKYADPTSRYDLALLVNTVPVLRIVGPRQERCPSWPFVEQADTSRHELLSVEPIHRHSQILTCVQVIVESISEALQKATHVFLLFFCDFNRGRKRFEDMPISKYVIAFRNDLI